jgi:hemolysin D
MSPDAEEKNGESMDAGIRAGRPGADAPAQMATRPNSGFVYKVHVQPEQTAFRMNGQAAPIQAGMTVQADIVTDRRRIIEFFLSPVVKYLDEGLSVR